MKLRIFRPMTLGALALVWSGVAGTAEMARAEPAGASPWVQSMHAKARLIAGTDQRTGQGAAPVVGVHLALDKGWKTYWRHPGEAGVPPSFDWSGSKNLKSAQVLWPAPSRFTDAYGTSIGYQTEVVFPIRLEAERADKPIALKARVEYAVCKDICIPIDVRLGLTVAPAAGQSTRFQPLIARFLDRVPQPAASGDAMPRVAHADAALDGTDPQLVIDAVFPGGGAGADLFVEGPKDFYVPLTEAVRRGEDGTVRFKVDLSKGDDPKRLQGKTLMLTLVSRGAQAETTWTLP